MTEDEFWTISLKGFFLKLFYHNQQEQERIERQHNLVRLQTLALVNIQLTKKDRITNPTKFWRFPWEEEEELLANTPTDSQRSHLNHLASHL